MADILGASALVAQGHRFINQKRALPINLLPAHDSSIHLRSCHVALSAEFVLSLGQ